MTTFTFVSIVLCLIVALSLVVRRVIGRATASVNLRDMTVSRQWLTQHQSNDRA